MTDNIGGSGALLFMYGPAALGGVAGALIFKNHRVLGGIGGVAAGFGLSMVLGAVSNAKNQAAVGAQNAKTLPSNGWSPVMPPSTVQTLTVGSRYAVMAELPYGVADLNANIQTAGWTNVLGPDVKNAKDPNNPSIQAYAFIGTWSGAPDAPVPSNVSVTPAPAGV